MTTWRCTLRLGHAGEHLHDPAQPAGDECNAALPTPDATERERALVRAGDFDCDINRREIHPNDHVAFGDEECDRIIAAVDRTHPRTPAAEVRCAKSLDGTTATASEIYVDGRLFVSADEHERARIGRPPSSPEMLVKVAEAVTTEVSDLLDFMQGYPDSPAAEVARPRLRNINAIIARVVAESGGAR